MGNFVEALSACRLLQSLDVSGNRVTTPRAIYQLSQAFATQRWPALRHVNLSSACVLMRESEVFLSVTDERPHALRSALLSRRCR